MVTSQKNGPQWRPLYAPAIAERLMTPEYCERIIAVARDRGFSPTGVSGGNERVHRYNAEQRVCDAALLTPTAHREVYDFVAQAIMAVNDKQYRFGITGMEPVQVLRYSVGSFFKEHSDLGYQYDDSAGRKISLIAQLSPEEAYEGGSLVLFGEEKMPKSQGTVCVFPSWLPHRVDELTVGTRYTLVAWAKGRPFN